MIRTRACLLSLSLLVMVGCHHQHPVPGDAGVDDLSVGDASRPADLATPADLTPVCEGGCDGGTCIAGMCCAPTDVCGTECCTSGQACLYEQCVTPGKACHTVGDCPTSQYCETALGGASDMGTSGADLGPQCTQPLPQDGRCLPSPVVCSSGESSDAGCLAPCEYHAPPGGDLTAQMRWQWGPTATTFPGFTDVWSTPTVGRIADGNCDGKIDELDSPNIVFVAGNAMGGNQPRNNGVLRMLDGRSGSEVWSLDKASVSSTGFLCESTAIGDVDADGRMDIVAITGEKYVVLVNASGTVVRTSDKPVPAAIDGWGGGPSIADMDGDGFPEIVIGSTVFTTTNGAITLAWTGGYGQGGSKADELLPTLADVTGDSKLELVAGNTVYNADGSLTWTTNLPDGFPGIGDFDKDGTPEIVLVASGTVWVLNSATGAIVLGPVTLPGSGQGGPPTVADFDGDGFPEIGVAQADFYSVLKADFGNGGLQLLWKQPNHDFSSSVTGSSVFDFEGDGRAEVVYADECFLWVYDGPTGAVRFSTSHTSFTATETSIVADIDGDGRAELLMVSNGADPVKWHCLGADGTTPAKTNGATWVPGPSANKGYSGLTLFGDSSHSWVGTRTLWNEHAYHVSNICDNRDDACTGANTYGSIPTVEQKNWSLPWLNNFRQNVQDHRLFDAPDATVSLSVACASPPTFAPSVRNIGLASLPAGVNVAIYDVSNGAHTLVGTAVTTHALGPSQGEVLTATPVGSAPEGDTFEAVIVIDPVNPTFHECRSDNDTSTDTQASGCSIQ